MKLVVARRRLITFFHATYSFARVASWKLEDSTRNAQEANPTSVDDGRHRRSQRNVALVM